MRRLDFQIERGETFAVMGMSGVGKSTLLKCVGGLIPATSGQIIVDGQNIVGMSETELREVRKKIGMVFQYAALFDSMTVFDNVAFGVRRQRRLSESELSALVTEKLSLVGLAHTQNMMPSQLSGGMQKRVGLARALAMDPPILLYDEPTSGLDPVTAAAIGELIVRMRDQLGVTSVVVSHDVPLIKEVSTRIGMLHRGKIIAVGTREEMENSDNPIVRQFMEGSIHGPIKI